MNKERRSNGFRVLAGRPAQLPARYKAYGLEERDLQKYAVLEEVPLTIKEHVDAAVQLELEQMVDAVQVEGEAVSPESLLLIVLYQQESDERPVYFLVSPAQMALPGGGSL